MNYENKLGGQMIKQLHVLNSVFAKYHVLTGDTESEPNIKKLRLHKCCCVEDLECTLCCRYSCVFVHRFITCIFNLHI